MNPRGYLINGNFYDENISDSKLDLVTPLYTEKPIVKGLSGVEIIGMSGKYDFTYEVDIIDFARAIEERHGIK